MSAYYDFDFPLFAAQHFATDAFDYIQPPAAFREYVGRGAVDIRDAAQTVRSDSNKNFVARKRSRELRLVAAVTDYVGDKFA